MALLRSVVLAGGGTGGHIYPLLAFADALRRHFPEVRITALGSPKGMENELIPPAGYDLRDHPGVPAAPVGQPGPAPHPGPDVEVRARRRQGDRRGPGRRGGRLRRVRVGAGLPGRVAARAADRDPRGERAAGRGQPAGHAVHQERRGRLPAPAAAGRVAARRPGGRACRCAPSITRLDRAGAARRRRWRHFGLRPDLPVLFVFGALAGRPHDQPGGGRGGQEARPTPASRCCTCRAGATTRSRCRATCRCRTWWCRTCPRCSSGTPPPT